MMVYEIQDLLHAILVLLMKVTEQGLFFSGDTAQTIAKRVVFRFCDINHATPVVKERSNLDGPKPMLLADEDIELLYKFL